MMRHLPKRTYNSLKVGRVSTDQIYLIQGDAKMFAEFVGQNVVLDLRSQYVCLGKLVQFDDQAVRLVDADMHDLRDSDTTRENYIAASLSSGIKRNRKSLSIACSDIVGISLLTEVVDE
jgi:hypothetical protein